MTRTTTPTHGEHAAQAGAWADPSGTASHRTRSAPRRRIPHLVTGALLVVACVAGALWWSTAAAARTPVVALADPVTVGQVLTRADLRTVEVSTDADLDLIPADRAGSLVGRPLATSLPAGALLNGEVVGPTALPGEGRSVVAVALAPGRYPPELAAGHPVRVLVTTSEGGPAVTEGPEPGAAWSATVLSLAPAGTDQTTVVSLEMSAEQAGQLAQVPAGRIALALQSGGGDR
ncbi:MULTISPECIES: SAF domain-containing protein [Prauserella salsuginis group]|uniref:SAF domain-containing protein n=1 Tax=Prauserella salsuginis TaxID=387889 RepID=A0ABW6FZY7_9PSEU|nr:MULTISPECIES: SAF domain-containing protein [Prauserella salsuginis group]MCR3721140.1 SAF domain-containing protein [Prauserella flava]MCR3734780.1 SAF domain-containing protein [Prauserella salsuginis]